MNLRTSSLVLVLMTAAAAAACGGKAAPAKVKAPDASATPFDQAAARAALAGTPRSSAPACGDPDDINQTLGDLFKQQGDGLQPADESFDCRPDLADAGVWECTWSVFAKPSAPSADDPCGGGSAGYQIIVKINADGTLVDGSFVCVAPG
jgi:ABC-type transport system substrate-binding protein